jgi:hypothetical protein
VYVKRKERRKGEGRKKERKNEKGGKMYMCFWEEREDKVIFFHPTMA